MPIEGPVRELAVADLLQLLFLSRRSGRLIVSTETGAITLHMRDGALVGATGTGSELRLGRLLVQTGGATEAQVRGALEAQKAEPARPLGELLVNAGLVRKPEVERQLRFQIEETVLDLIRLREGQLRFEEGNGRRPSTIQVQLGTDVVLMNATRRLDELAEIVPANGAGDPLPRLAPPRGRVAPPLQLHAFEWEVLAAVDGRRTLPEIARSLGRGQVEVAKALYALAEAGVIEVGTGEAGERSGGERASLLGAIDRAIRAGDRTEAAALLMTLEAGDEGAPPNAETLVLRARVQALAGAWREARKSLERAIAIDPVLAEGYYHLARTAIALGDLAAASEALDVHHRLHDRSAARRDGAARMRDALAALRRSTEEAES